MRRVRLWITQSSIIFFVSLSIIHSLKSLLRVIIHDLWLLVGLRLLLNPIHISILRSHSIRSLRPIFVHIFLSSMSNRSNWSIDSFFLWIPPHDHLLLMVLVITLLASSTLPLSLLVRKWVRHGTIFAYFVAGSHEVLFLTLSPNNLLLLGILASICHNVSYICKTNSLSITGINVVPRTESVLSCTANNLWSVDLVVLGVLLEWDLVLGV